ncbi:hypothetical protein DPMN_009394 [Dreissena polymorpha]|uniref:Secreted protein n=1 Tax=Dreissena polymorpha TaxID=45954 RepID=A0A9D4N0E5_DREPO|nr:hypothetical protein DPMN_009394 [Dreissena polymorpha]
MRRLISTAILSAYVLVPLELSGSHIQLLCLHMSSCTWMVRLISKLLCWHMSPCHWMGRLISSATLLPYVLVYLDGATHIYCFSVSICPRVLGWDGSYLSYSVGICPRALGWGASYLQLLC